MLRHYDSIGLVSPTARTAGGYREYSTGDIQRLFHVESLRSLGVPLKDMRRALDDSAFTPIGLIADLIAGTRQRIAHEEELLRRLTPIAEAGPAEWTDVLRLVSLMRALDSSDASDRLQSALATATDSVPPASLIAAALLDEADPNVAGALQWALLRSQGDALEVLAVGLHSADGETRRRAVTSLAALEGDGARDLLAQTIGHSDRVVSTRAALALGSRGDTVAIATLITMVVDGVQDVDAAEALGTIARRHQLVDAISGLLAAELDRPGIGLEGSLRIVQALAELPGAATRHTLEALLSSSTPRLAGTARFILDQAQEGDPRDPET